MSYWNSPDGIQGTSLEGVATETKKCECGCDVYFDADQTIVHKITSAVISFDCLDSYDELLEKERNGLDFEFTERSVAGGFRLWRTK